MATHAPRQDDRAHEVVDDRYTGEGVVPLVTGMANAVERLVSDHLTLARLELAEDARITGRRLARVGTCVFFGVVGWALVCAGLAVLLSPLLGLGWALLAVGGLGVLGGALAAVSMLLGASRHDLMDDSGRELTSTVKVLGTAVVGAPEAGHVGN